LKDKILGTDEEELKEETKEELRAVSSPSKKMESEQFEEEIPEERYLEKRNLPRSGEGFVVTHPE
jgi:hypothetical protein